VRVFSAYGRGLQRQVVYDAIRMLRASEPGRPAVFRGTGQEARDFVHVDDVARGVHAVIQGAAWRGEAYNLASGASTTIGQLVEMVQSILGAPTAATFDGVTERGHPLVWQADIARIRALGFEPAWTLKRGIADLVESWEADHASERS
jgi:nucleoside-diphosphate-sugar epimerase